jgi:ATP synthase protein I
MSEDHGKDRLYDPHDIGEEIGEKEARKLRARRHKNRSIWFGLGTFGMVGWSVAIPTLIGVALGIWIDRNLPTRFSWTLMLLLGGLLVGCLNAWYWLNFESRLIQEEETDEELDHD